MWYERLEEDSCRRVWDEIMLDDRHTQGLPSSLAWLGAQAPILGLEGSFG